MPASTTRCSRIPIRTRRRRRVDSNVREMRGIPRWMSLNREEPVSSSRMMSGVQRSPMTSVPMATGQYCPCMSTPR